MFSVYFNDISSMDLGIKAIKRPNIPIPKRKYQTKSIDGKDGDMYIDTETYEDITFSIDFNFIDGNNFYEKCRQVKRWVNRIKNNKLVFSDDSEVFYKVKKAEIKDNIERTYKILGKFTVDFICEAYTYYSYGLNLIPITNNMTLYNSYDLTKPLYNISGTGILTLTVNSKPVTINLDGQVTIDTNLEECFNSNGVKTNLAIKTGTFKDLYLLEDTNTFSYTIASGGSVASISVTPNWRTI